MTEKQETRGDRAWNWVCRIAGLGMFLYSPTLSIEKAAFMAFLGICVAMLPADVMRTVLLRRWRNGGTTDKESP